MLQIIYKNTFRKDVKRAEKRGLDLNRLKEVVQILAENKPLPRKFVEHPLAGDYKGYKECHLQPDWLMIYKKEAGRIIFVRTGTHADLFKC